MMQRETSVQNTKKKIKTTIDTKTILNTSSWVKVNDTIEGSTVGHTIRWLINELCHKMLHR